MIKRIIKIISIFAIGMVGGIFSSQIVMSRLLDMNYDSLLKTVAGPIYFTEKKEITVQENTALQDSIDKVKESIIGVRTKTKEGKIIYGSGFILTQDGLVITLSSLIPKGQDFAFFVGDKAQDYQILKRDSNNNLALIKIGKEGLEPCAFADLDKLKIGQRVFLLGAVFGEKDILEQANQGIVKIFSQDKIETNIFEDNNSAGSALFNIDGELLGLNTINEEGRVVAIPVNTIRNFAGF